MAKYEGPQRLLCDCMIEAKCCPHGCINPFDGNDNCMDYCPDCGTEMRQILVMDLPCNKCFEGTTGTVDRHERRLAKLEVKNAELTTQLAAAESTIGRAKDVVDSSITMSSCAFQAVEDVRSLLSTHAAPLAIVEQFRCDTCDELYDIKREECLRGGRFKTCGGAILPVTVVILGGEK